MELKKGLLRLLEERLAQHDNNRKEVQDKLQDIYSESIKEADLLEEKLNGELQQYFNSREERILSLIDKLNNNTQKDDLNSLTAEALTELSIELKLELTHVENADNFVGLYEVKTARNKLDINTDEENDNRKETTIKQLREHLDKIHETITSTQNKVTEACTKKRTEAEELKKKIDGELEGKFNAEDSRLQAVISELRDNNTTTYTEDVFKVIQRAKIALLVRQSYEIVKYNHESKEEKEKEKPKIYFMNVYELKIEKNISLKVIDFEERKPTNLKTSFTDKGEFSLSFTLFSEDEIEILLTATINSSFKVSMKMWEKDKSEEEKDSKLITKDYNVNDKQICFVESFKPNTKYNLKMRIEHQNLSSKWSDEIEFTTPDFKDLCVWKECPDYTNKYNKYSVDEDNPRIATKISGNYLLKYCSIIGNTPLPPNKVTSWSIKMLNTEKNNINNIFIGVAPFDINLGIESCSECGWYFKCFYSELFSGPPHKYRGKEYGPRGYCGKYFHIGDSVGVVMNITKGDLSFVLNGVNFGVAYEGIPLDKPLVPCVFLGNEGDSVEIDTSEVKENEVDSSIPVPSNIITKSITWDSITLVWGTVEGAEFYHIEVNGDKFYASETSTFIKRDLSLDTEYSFRIRTVKGSFVSEWSDSVKQRTVNGAVFKDCVWKECPLYYINKNDFRIASNTNYRYCTIIGNISLPLNKITSWSINILKSRNNNGDDIYIGVAPFDIDQNDEHNYKICGWYLGCYYSTLWSGPPHKYEGKMYGLRERDGDYVHTGDSIGVVMDTAKGELSFVVNRVNCGVAYEGIPLDKPLVPCVILEKEGDSVELVI